MVVEVLDSSLRFDREVKLPLYARSNIPETWIVDLEHDVLIVCRSPVADRYSAIQSLASPGTIAPALLPQCAIDLSGIF